MKYTLLVFLGLLATMLKADVATFLNGWSLSQGTSELPLNNASGVRQYNYRIQTSGTYRITTNGKPVDASICIVMKNNATEDLNVTLILDQCHLAPTSQSVVTSSDSDYTHYTIAPIVIDRPKNKGYKTNLKILFEGENALIARSEVGSYAAVWHSAITAAPSKGFTQENPLKVEIHIARAPWADKKSSSLTLVGRTSLVAKPATPYAPLYFPVSYGTEYVIDAMVTLASGNLLFKTSDGTLDSNPVISPLAEAKVVRLEGATVNVVVDSSVTSGGLRLQDLSGVKERCSLFRATTVTMDGGEIRSRGGKPISNTPMKSVGVAYDTSFSYPDELFVLPGKITRGILRLNKETQLHGYPLDTEGVVDMETTLCACFTGTPTNPTSSLVAERVEVDDEQIIVVNAPDAMVKFDSSVKDVENELNAFELFEFPLEPTLEGFRTLDFDVGFDRFLLEAEGPLVRVKIILPEESVVNAEKTYHLTVWATSGETQQVVYDAPVIFRDEEASGIYQVDLQMPAAYPLITFPRGTIYYQMSLSECRD